MKNKRNYTMNYLGATSKTRGGHYVGTMEAAAEAAGIKAKDYPSNDYASLTDEVLESQAQTRLSCDKEFLDMFNEHLFGGK